MASKYPGSSSSSSPSSSSGGAGRPTYNSLKSRFYAIGQQMATLTNEPPHPGTCASLLKSALVHLNCAPRDAALVFEDIGWPDLDQTALDQAAASYAGAANKRARATSHRKVMDGTDEQISTASLEQLLQGFGSVSPVNMANRNLIYLSLCWARLPTCITAIDALIAGKHIRMAHPTSRTDRVHTAIIGSASVSLPIEGHSAANAPGDFSVPGHRAFDIERAATVADVAEAYMNAGHPVERVLLEMVHAAASFTLEYVAPPFATNVNFTQNNAVQSAAHRLREMLKGATNLLHHTGNHMGAHKASQHPTVAATGPRGRTPDRDPTVAGLHRPRSPSPERK